MNHLQEWTASGVDDQLTRLNVIPLKGDRAYDYLFYSDTIPRRNDGRVVHSFLKRYEHLEEGGWWCSGINLLTGDEDLWGCFKPLYPRLKGDSHKKIKYEHPPKTATGLFALRVPLHLWQKIAQRYQIELTPEDLDESQADLGFWQWFVKHPSIPLCITEGAKKAGALLTAGYVAVALPGIHGGYRVPKDEQGNRIGKSCLIPQLAYLTSEKRSIYLVFDQDSKPKTVQAVNAAIRRLGYLLTQQDCCVHIVAWNPELGKGVDDFIAQTGEKAFQQAYDTALSLEIWKAQSLSCLTYTPNLQLQQRYLEGVEIPETAKLVAIQSPKGTGKTQLIKRIVTEAIANQQRVLVIGHRVQLVEALCQDFGLKYITEARQNSENALTGYGLCIDSLHPHSQAQFKATDWEDSLIIIDEVEQVLWHALNSSTCRDQRVLILKSFKTLMQNVLGGKGRVLIADADLSDISIDYLQALAGAPLEPFVIQNTWKPSPEDAWQVYRYADSTPKKLVRDLERHIAEGGKPFVCLSAQKTKSKWGTCTLEAYLQQKFPQAKILRIDSESLAEPNHPAYSCIANLNSVLKNYDVVLASPSIETGISIDLQGHFTSVWGIAQGIQGENSVRQTLGRVRENVPRHLWVASYGFNRVGNGSTSIPSLLTSGQRLTQLNIRLLQQADFSAFDDLDLHFQAESLLCWAKMAVRFNAAMIQYRESVFAALRQEGHFVQDRAVLKKPRLKNTSSVSLEETQQSLNIVIDEVRNRNYQAECEAIAVSENLSDAKYNILKKRMVKTPQERRSQRKYELKKRYGIPVTPQLVLQDDQGWYGKLRLHYFLTVGQQYLAERDASVAHYLLEQGQGDLFLPDFNHSQLGAAIGIMKALGIPILLKDPERELHNLQEDLQRMADLALNNRSFIKTATGIGIAKNATPIMILRRFVEQIGYGLQCIRCGGDRKKRIRIYRLVNPEDNRFAVFQYWLRLANQTLGFPTQSQNFNLLPQLTETEPVEHIQLTLNFSEEF